MLTTPNLSLKKPEGTDTVDIADFNANADILDTAVTAKETPAGAQAKVDAAAALKVDKVAGKQLSTEDYTTTEKTKLSGIAANANNYIHPNHTGDVTSNGDGVTTIAPGVIVNADISSTAAIDATKIANGLVTNTEFQYLDGITSAVQTQLNSKTPNTDFVRQPGYAAATGTANTYAVTISPVPSAYVDGMAVSVKINVDASAASTLNVNGLGAKPLKKSNGNDVTNFKANGVYTFRYNSITGNFILQGEGGSGNATAGDLLASKTASTDAGDIVGTLSLTGTAADVDVLAGQTYYNTDAKTKRTGTKPNQGALTVTPSSATQTFSGGSYTGITVNPQPGKRWATGTIPAATSPPGSLAISGLTFTPTLVVFYQTSTTGASKESVIFAQKGVDVYAPSDYIGDTVGYWTVDATGVSQGFGANATWTSNGVAVNAGGGYNDTTFTYFVFE